MRSSWGARRANSASGSEREAYVLGALGLKLLNEIKVPYLQRLKLLLQREQATPTDNSALIL